MKHGSTMTWAFLFNSDLADGAGLMSLLCGVKIKPQSKAQVQGTFSCCPTKRNQTLSKTFGVAFYHGWKMGGESHYALGC
jgi:hypothetical protein